MYTLILLIACPQIVCLYLQYHIIYTSPFVCVQPYHVHESVPQVNLVRMYRYFITIILVLFVFVVVLFVFLLFERVLFLF